MSHACRERELDALLAGELSPAEAERVRAHAGACAACTHALAWLRLERGWMTQRARRAPARPALSFSALEARLAATAAKAPPVRPLPTPARSAPRAEASRRGEWSHRGKMALAAAAAVAFFLVNVAQVRPVSSGEETWTQDALATGMLACVDTSGEAVAAMENSFGACLIASPVLSSHGY